MFILTFWSIVSILSLQLSIDLLLSFNVVEVIQQHQSFTFLFKVHELIKVHHFFGE